KALFAVLAVLCFAVASYQIWSVEKDRADKVEGRFVLSLSIEQLVSPLHFRRKDDNRQLCALALIVRVNNSGAPTSLTGWRAAAVSNGLETALQPTLIGRDVDFGKDAQYGPGDDVLQKAAETPIAQ